MSELNPMDGRMQSEENVEQTLQQIANNRKEREKYKTNKFFSIVLKPFIWFADLVKKVFSSLTLRITLIYFILTLVTVTAIVLVSILMVNDYVSSQNLPDGDVFMLRFNAVIVVIGVIVVAMVTTLAYLSTRFSLAPIKEMEKKIRSITSEDLSKRIDEKSSASELVELAHELNNLLEDLEKSFDRQRKFISDASHELKTPIAVIQGYANLLKRWGKNDPMTLNESVESIASEAENMKNLVERLLFLARLGKYMVKKKDVSLIKLTCDIVDGYRMVDTGRKITVMAEDISINTDPSLLTECLRAMVDNAIKYSQADSEILVFARKQNDQVRIGVTDHGVGISKEDQQRIFDRFYRCDSVRKRNDNSCGLGLTICASIVETLGATITVDSIEGEGTTFTVIFGGEDEVRNIV